MKNKILRNVLCIVTVITLCVPSFAFASPNVYPEIIQWFEDENYEAINEWIYDDQTNNITATNICDITVEDQAPLWKANVEMLGMCTGVVWPFDDVLFNGSSGTELSEEYLEFADKMTDYPVMRLGFGNNSNMLTLVGPLSERKAGASVLSPEDEETYLAVEPIYRTLSSDRIAKTGTLEMVNAAEAMNPNISFTLILPYAYATPEDNANLIRFFCDDKDESEWGALRAKYGHPKPIKLHSVELGNELYLRESWGEEEDKRQLELYVRQFKAHADEIGKYYPDLGVSVCLYCMDGEAHDVWNVPLIKELGPYLMEHYDENNRWVSLHHYYSGYELAYTQNRVQVIMDSLDEILGEDHNIRGLFSEHSKYAQDWIAPTTLESGLATCQFLNTMFQWDEFTAGAAHYFDWHSHNIWNIFRRSPLDGTLVRSGPDFMYSMYLDNMGDRIFRSNVVTLDDSEIGDDNSVRKRFSVCAMGKGKNEMKLIMANRAENSNVDLTFKFKSGNSYTVVSEEILTAPNAYSFPYSADTQDIITRTKNEKNIPNFSKYTMPSKSMVVLTLKSNKTIAALGNTGSGIGGDVVYEGEEGFEDISSHWAKNEINILAQDGIIIGNGDGVFNPNNKITRAEFAVLLSRIFASDSDYSSKYIPDVDNNVWYADGIKKTIANGYMRGYENGTFGPENNISLTDAVSTIYRALSDGTTDYELVDNDATLSKVKFVDSLTEWEKQCFAGLISNNMFSKFYEGRNVDKNRSITRAEAAVLLQRLKSVKGL